METFDLVEDLKFREIIYQVTDEALFSKLKNSSLTLYAGFDPTADTLHVGSLLPLLTLRRFQLAGHTPIAIVGGATGMIGDPSGKTQERQLLSEEQIQNNLEGIKKVISKFLDFSESSNQKAILVNNYDWFKSINIIQFLRDIGKHFTVNHMMAKESVKSRLEDREHGISYTEFSYMLLQAYDFYYLNKNYGCTLQIGGSDQWGNITAGLELIRRMHFVEHNKEMSQEIYGLTHPLVMKADGTKFGKSEKGTIWLDSKRTSSYQFYQYFIQTSDLDVIKFLKYFTFLTHSQIQDLEHKVKTEPEKREAQKTLAYELTKLVHGEGEAKKVVFASQALFGEEIRELDENTLLEVFDQTPSLEKPFLELDHEGIPLVDVLVQGRLCQSKAQARTDIQSGGIYINNSRINDSHARIKKDSLIANRFVVLRKGKKNYLLLKFI